MVLGPFRDSNTVAQDFVLTSLLVQLEVRSFVLI